MVLLEEVEQNTNVQIHLINLEVLKEYVNLTNVIKKVCIVITGRCNMSIIQSKAMSIDITLPDPLPENFLDISQITNNTVISWIENNEEYLTAKTQLINDIFEMYNSNVLYTNL